jgi:hypothetical protein
MLYFSDKRKGIVIKHFDEICQYKSFKILSDKRCGIAKINEECENSYRNKEKPRFLKMYKIKTTIRPILRR